jgi:tetratricopeptide (TPR) repeat protein
MVAELSEGIPGGGAYEWLQRGLALLERGDAAAAAVLLVRAADEQPGSASVLEALGRAQYQSGRVDAAAGTFERLVAAFPDADYAHFGLGLSLTRLGRLPEAVEHLALAAAMRPQRPEYGQHLRQARATLRARREATRG